MGDRLDLSKLPRAQPPLLSEEEDAIHDHENARPVFALTFPEDQP